MKRLLLCLLLLLPLPVMAQEAGSFTTVINQVDVLKSGSTTPAKVETKVFVMDTVRTGEQSRARVRMVDSSTINVAPKSKVMVESYMFEKTIYLLDGVIEMNSDKNMTIKTTTAVAGVRG